MVHLHAVRSFRWNHLKDAHLVQQNDKMLLAKEVSGRESTTLNMYHPAYHFMVLVTAHKSGCNRTTREVLAKE